MSTLNIILSIISVISFIIGVWSFINSLLIKSREKSNVEVLKSKLEDLHQGIHSVLLATNAIVQIPKSRTVTIEEIQDHARVIRGQLIILSDGVKKQRRTLDDWKFGDILRTAAFDENELHIEKEE